MVIPMLRSTSRYVVCMLGVKNKNHHTHPYLFPDNDKLKLRELPVRQIWRPGFLGSPLPNRSNALRSSILVVSHRTPRSRQNRLVVESPAPLKEDVFVCCTRFLRMYLHRVSSRHWPSPLTHQDAAWITQGLLLTSSRMAKSQKKPGRGARVRHCDSD